MAKRGRPKKARPDDLQALQPGDCVFVSYEDADEMESKLKGFRRHNTAHGVRFRKVDK